MSQIAVPVRPVAYRSHDCRFHVRLFIAPAAHQTFNDNELILQALLDGAGLAQLPAYQVCDRLGNGQLIACLTQYAPDERGHYVCYLSRKHLPARIRVFVDYMIEHIRALNLECLTPEITLSP